MLAARTSPSIGRMVQATVYVLVLCDYGWSQGPQAAKPSGNASILRSEPALQVKLTVKFKRPKALGIINRLSIETKLDLTLDDNIDRERPVFVGLDFYNTPAWIILEQLAKSKVIQGQWERHGKGYRLTSPLPPLARRTPNRFFRLARASSSCAILCLLFP